VNKIILSLFLTGLLFGSGPCIASCGPFLIAYIAGTKKDIPKSIATYILFSSARIFVYLGLSLAIFFLSRFVIEKILGNLSKYLLILGGGIIVLIGAFLTLGKRWEFNPWQFLYQNILEHDKKSIVAVGLIVGLLPCAPLLAILSYVGLISRTWFSSLVYTLSFGVGTFISPLILLTVLAGLIPRFLGDKKILYYQIFSFICGLTIVFLGIQLIIRAF
jgi:sulfite exporter TauE/SafE